MKRYAITNKIPVPQDYKKSRSKFPLLKMRPGDSFLIPYKDIPNPDKPQHVVPYSMARALSIKIISRREKRGLRVWRVN